MSASYARRSRRVVRRGPQLPEMPAELSAQLTALLEHVAPLSRAEQEAHGVFREPDGSIRIEFSHIKECQHADP